MLDININSKLRGLTPIYYLFFATVLITVTVLLLVVTMVALLGVWVLARRLMTAEKRIAVPLRDELSRKADRLREVEDRNRSRDLFLAALSHELRTPLSGIVGIAHLLDQTGLDARQQEYTRLIAHAGTTVLEIVDDMLTFARVQAGKAETTYTTFSIHQLIDGMLALQNINAHQRGLALASSISADVPRVLTGERGKLNQVLLNIIGNAIKFTDRGDIQIQIERERCDNNLVWLRFTIVDTGIGFDSEDKDRLFMPFVQGENGGDDRGGTGLGLAICRRLIQTMGGEISIDGQRGKGTRVSFTMPFYLPDPATKARFLETASYREHDEYTGFDAASILTLARGQLILVIEDDETNRLVCMRILALLGFHPMVAADSSQALQIVYEGRHRPDAILVDVNLAGESGAELAVRLQTECDARWAEIPLIAMSADVSGAAQKSAENAGIRWFIKKPFSADQLGAILQDALGHTPDSLPAAPSFSGRFVHVVAADRQLKERVDLDEDWLTQELEDLGFNTLLEMLNIFRATAATVLRSLSRAVAQRDIDQALSLAHKLSGSALNLGMRGVAAHANALQVWLKNHEIQDAAQLKPQLDALEACCHASADVVRAYLVEHAEKRVAFSTRSDQ